MKARANKLDPFANRLREWAEAGKTLQEMQAELLKDGCRAALSSIGEYLARQRQEGLERAMFGMIASGGRMQRELDTAYEKSGEPDIEQLIRVTKTLIMSLQVQGVANPKLLVLANSMQQTVLQYLSGKTKAELEAAKLELGERRVKLLEEKGRQADSAAEIAGSGLSNEEKVARMKQVFGMA